MKRIAYWIICGVVACCLASCGGKKGSSDTTPKDSVQVPEFSADSATYVQAETAYFVAYTQYTQAYANSQQLWTDYVNGLLGNASIEIYSLVS